MPASLEASLASRSLRLIDYALLAMLFYDAYAAAFSYDVISYATLMMITLPLFADAFCYAVAAAFAIDAFH